MARIAFLVFATLLAAGCTAPAPDIDPQSPVGENAGPADVGSAQALGDGRVAYRLTQWPADAQLLEVRFASATEARVLVEGTFGSTWAGAPGTDGLPQKTSNGDIPQIELFQATLYEEGIPANAIPVADVAIWRSFGVVILSGQPFDLRIDPVGVPGVPPIEATSGGWGAYGSASASYTDPGFEALVGPGRDWGFVLAATNLTGARTAPQLDMTFTADAAVTFEARAATDPVALWSNGPRLGGGQGASVGVAQVPLRAAVERVTDASAAFESLGRVGFAFVPWAMATNATAHVQVEAPDLAYDIEHDLDDAGSTYRCTRSCDALGGNYAVNAGFGPAGTYRFTVPEATCVLVGSTDCLGGFIALDLGRAKLM